MKKTARMLTKRAGRSVCGLLAAGLLFVSAMPMQAAAAEEEAAPEAPKEAEKTSEPEHTDSEDTE